MEHSTLRSLRDYGITILLAAGVALFIRSYFLEAYRIPSASMKPTLMPGDIIFVTKWTYSKDAIKLSRGDVILFSSEDPATGTSRDYIKRVVGLPGDQVAFRKGHLLLNGHRLSSQNRTSDHCFQETFPGGASYEACSKTASGEEFGPETVPPDSVFVLGDFRTGFRSQLDQKKRKGWGAISVNSVKGKAKWIWLSIEPAGEIQGSKSGFPRIRFNRMFRRID